MSAINRFRYQFDCISIGNCSILRIKNSFFQSKLFSVLDHFFPRCSHAFIRNKSINVQWSRTKLSIIEHRRFGCQTPSFVAFSTATANISSQNIYEIIHNKYKTHVMPLPLCRRWHRCEYFFHFIVIFSSHLRGNVYVVVVSVLRFVAKSLRCVRAKTQNLLEIIQFRGDFTRFHCSQCKRNRNEPNQTDKRAHRVTHSA